MQNREAVIAKYSSPSSSMVVSMSTANQGTKKLNGKFQRNKQKNGRTTTFT
jgi:hypothetical protein